MIIHSVKIKYMLSVHTANKSYTVAVENALLNNYRHEIRNKPLWNMNIYKLK